VRKELELKGLTPTRNNAKHCVFREELLKKGEESFWFLLGNYVNEDKKEKEIVDYKSTRASL
jgi:hypothetical protein